MVEHLTVNQAVSGSSPLRGVLRLGRFATSLSTLSLSAESKYIERTIPSEQSESRERESRYMYYVYILECSNKTFYTGITTDLDRRLKEHKSSKGSHYTSYNRGIRIRYSEKYQTRSEACRREAQIKGWSRTKKLALLKNDKGILKAASRCRNR